MLRIEAAKTPGFKDEPVELVNKIWEFWGIQRWKPFAGLRFGEELNNDIKDVLFAPLFDRYNGLFAFYPAAMPEMCNFLKITFPECKITGGMFEACSEQRKCAEEAVNLAKEGWADRTEGLKRIMVKRLEKCKKLVEEMRSIVFGGWETPVEAARARAVWAIILFEVELAKTWLAAYRFHCKLQ